MDWLQTVIGGIEGVTDATVGKSSTTQTVSTTAQPSTNYSYVIGGVILFVVGVGVVIYLMKRKS